MAIIIIIAIMIIMIIIVNQKIGKIVINFKCKKQRCTFVKIISNHIKLKKNLAILTFVHNNSFNNNKGNKDKYG